MSEPKRYGLLTGFNADGVRTAMYSDKQDRSTYEVVGTSAGKNAPAEILIVIRDAPGAAGCTWAAFNAEALVQIIRHVAPEEFARAAREFVAENGGNDAN
ncbi:hypothetical protein ACUIAC_00965 [Dermabacteraceae bacterium P13138]